MHFSWYWFDVFFRSETIFFQNEEEAVMAKYFVTFISPATYSGIQHNKLDKYIFLKIFFYNVLFSCQEVLLQFALRELCAERVQRKKISFFICWCLILTISYIFLQNFASHYYRETRIGYYHFQIEKQGYLSHMCVN